VKKFFVVFALLLVACSEDLTLPPLLTDVLVVPPAPGNFTVTTSDNMVFDLDWTISDPTVVKFYRIWWELDGFSAPIDTTVATSWTNMDTDFRFPIPVPGIFWGVSSVSVDNVESRIVFGSAE
jgi:hypothetical protein